METAIVLIVLKVARQPPLLPEARQSNRLSIDEGTHLVTNNGGVEHFHAKATTGLILKCSFSFSLSALLSVESLESRSADVHSLCAYDGLLCIRWNESRYVAREILPGSLRVCLGL
jgi:hypothetical protein